MRPVKPIMRTLDVPGKKSEAELERMKNSAMCISLASQIYRDCIVEKAKTANAAADEIVDLATKMYTFICE
jgi:hypothetical protein